MTEISEYQIEIDDLAVGLTRPPMFFGVKLQTAILNLMCCILSYVFFQTIWVVPIFGLLHLIAMRISIKEPRFIDLYISYLSYTPPLKNVIFWGKCNSYFPK